jgi:hypothetical protein
MAILALVDYDGLLIRVEKLAGELDKLGAETVDAIAIAAPVYSPTVPVVPTAAASPYGTRPGSRTDVAATPGRAPHQSRFVQDEGATPRRRRSEPESGF